MYIFNKTYPPPHLLFIVSLFEDIYKHHYWTLENLSLVLDFCISLATCEPKCLMYILYWIWMILKLFINAYVHNIYVWF